MCLLLYIATCVNLLTRAVGTQLIAQIVSIMGLVSVIFCLYDSSILNEFLLFVSDYQ